MEDISHNSKMRKLLIVHVFGGLCVTLFIQALFILPETCQKPIEEIDTIKIQIVLILNNLFDPCVEDTFSIDIALSYQPGETDGKRHSHNTLQYDEYFKTVCDEEW